MTQPTFDGASKEELIRKYGLNTLSKKYLQARREAARMHMNDVRLTQEQRDNWTVIIILCNERLDFARATP